MYESKIECQVCKGVSKDETHLIHRHEFELDINLDIPANRGKIKLSDLLIDYFKTETVDGYSCIKCSLRKYLMRFTDDLTSPIWKIDKTLSEKDKSDLVSAL